MVTVPGEHKALPVCMLGSFQCTFLVLFHLSLTQGLRLSRGQGRARAGAQQLDSSHQGFATGLPTGWGLVPLGNGTEGVIHTGGGGKGG